MIKTASPQKSWIETPSCSDFPLENIPFGIVEIQNRREVVTRIGDTIVRLSVLAHHGFIGFLSGDQLQVFEASELNPFIGLGKTVTREVRLKLQELFSEGNSALQSRSDVCRQAFIPAHEAVMRMPVRIGDYTDFYSSIEHATNVGIMFRDPANALLPNWRHLPVGYHGRASSIVLSGTPIHRPKGQTRPTDEGPVVFGPTKQLDFELEMAFITSGSTLLGNSIPVERAEDYIFGLVILNDLSARDIQRWEYVPLGPFLSKSFGSIISPWVVTLEALEPFRTSGPVQNPEPLPYLRQSKPGNFDIQLEVELQAPGCRPLNISKSNFGFLYWSMAQQLAHQTIAGCNIRVGDLYASGTISGPMPDSYGSMLELCWKGTRPLSLPDGSERTFLHDGDSVSMKAFAEKQGLRIGFGECETTILPALP